MRVRGSLPSAHFVEHIYKDCTEFTGRIKLFHGGQTGLDLLYRNDEKDDFAMYYDRDTFEAIDALSKRPGWTEKSGWGTAMLQRADELTNLLSSDPKTYVYVAGVERIRDELDDVLTTVVRDKGLDQAKSRTDLGRSLGRTAILVCELGEYGIAVPLALIVFTCLLICAPLADGFEIVFRIHRSKSFEGVRGGTINAISSSMPELLTTLIALFVLSDRVGFSLGLGTTTGSALFNAMIIPAVCILTVVGTVVHGVRVDCIHVSTKVLLRDGISLIFCECVLILLINGKQLHWWQGLVLMLLYFGYLTYMLKSMKNRDHGSSKKQQDNGQSAEDVSRSGVSVLLSRFLYWTSLGPLIDLERWFVREHHLKQMEEEEWNG